MTREEVAADFAAAKGEGFAANEDTDKAIDALHAAASSGVAGIIEFISLVQMLLPLLSDNLPAVLELLRKIFSPRPATT